MTGSAGAIHVSQGFLLGATVLMETAIAMVLGITPTLYYLFFAMIEIACTLLIVWYALRWKPIAQ